MSVLRHPTLSLAYHATDENGTRESQYILWFGFLSILPQQVIQDWPGNSPSSSSADFLEMTLDGRQVKPRNQNAFKMKNIMGGCLSSHCKTYYEAIATNTMRY